MLSPLVAPDCTLKVLVCEGSSGEMPDPIALSDYYTINPPDASPSWQSTDSLPNEPQIISDGILFPDRTVLIIDGARISSGGGFQANDPVLQPVIYNPETPAAN